ncbi:hypothetical protein T472_0219345 [Youngiibacter fragilis 232.1]|uniref:Prepilin type IV endopeptidase peptidase domain-containing protein n=2 Tax=Youngiibacter TaxID=1408818 RepID=V7I1V0_9CLOT|nr:hypothetical protein T472_0219345 [Youngiibacter fragilis 232.1]
MTLMQLSLSAVSTMSACAAGAMILLKDGNEVKKAALAAIFISSMLLNHVSGISGMEVVFSSVLLVSAITDAYTGEVHQIPMWLLFPAATAGFIVRKSYVAALFGFLVWIYRKDRRLKYWFGEGDLYILAAIAMMYGTGVFRAMAIGAALALVWCLVKRSREAYFIPFLYLGLMVSRMEVTDTLFYFFI